MFFFSSSSILQMAIFHLVKDAPRKPALCHLSGCLKSAALCQWPQSRAAEQPLGEVQGPSVTHVLLAGGQPRLLRLCFLEKRKKKGEGRRGEERGWGVGQALRACRERWLSHLQPLPFPGLIRPGSKRQCWPSKGNKESIPIMWELTVEFHPSKGSGRVERNIQPGKEENLQRCFRSVLWRGFNLDKRPQDRNQRWKMNLLISRCFC